MANFVLDSQSFVLAPTVLSCSLHRAESSIRRRLQSCPLQVRMASSVPSRTVHGSRLAYSVTHTLSLTRFVEHAAIGYTSLLPTSRSLVDSVYITFTTRLLI